MNTLTCPDIRQKKYFIFDFDGTIADTNPLHTLAFEKVMAEEGLEGFEYHRFAGQKTREVFTRFLTEKGRDFDDDFLAELVGRKQTGVRKLMAEKIEPFPGAGEFIALLKEKQLGLLLATSASRAGVTLALQKLGLYDSFAHIITGDEVTRAKPEPEIFLKVMDLAGIAPAEALVIEDSLSGALAAERAGLDVVIVNNHGLEERYYTTSFFQLMDLVSTA